MKTRFNHRLVLPSVLLPTLGFLIASLGYHDWLHLGAEYDEIARAIWKGRGFSDPFGIETGPTAWMPPVLPFSLASIYWISNGSRTFVMIFFLMLQWTAIASTIGLVLREAIRLDRYVWGLAATFIGLAMNFDMLFGVTHDHALLLLLVNGLFLVMIQGCKQHSNRTAIMQGVFGGFIALCNPILAAVWATWIVVVSGCLRTVVVAATVSMVVITPWTIRNYIIFDRFVPIKSASKFEFYQALCVSRDGVVGPACFSEHPWNRDNAARREYELAGEAAFIDARGRPAMQKWRRSPIDCLDRLINRFLTAAIWSETPSGFGLSRAFGFFNRLFYVWPFVSLAVLVVCKDDRTWFHDDMRHRWAVAAFMYVGVLLPYVLVSYYARYAAPLIGIKCLLVLYLVDASLLKFVKVRF